MGYSTNPLLINESMSVQFSSDSWRHTIKCLSLLLFISKRKKYRIWNFVPFSKISNRGGDTLINKRNLQTKHASPSPVIPTLPQNPRPGIYLGPKVWSSLKVSSHDLIHVCSRRGPAHKGMSSFTQMWTQLKSTAECLWPHSVVPRWDCIFRA